MTQLDTTVDTVLLGGLGNIGSFCVGLLPFLPGLKRVILVDRDCYDNSNLRSQQINPADIGQPKVRIQARRLRRLNPDLHIEAIHDDLDNIPLGRLRAGIALGGLDSLEARLILHQAAWRHRMPFLDAGVDPGSGLVRLNAYVPGPNQPCFECQLDPVDYTTHLKTRMPCQAGPDTAPGDHVAPTQGNPFTGALAAALLVENCRILMATPGESPLIGHESLLDSRHHRHYLSQCDRNVNCRFDHETWEIRPIGGISLHSKLPRALAEAARLCGLGEDVEWQVAGKPFVRRLRCSGCDHVHDRFHVASRLPSPQRHCPQCVSRPLMPAGIDLIEWLNGDHAEEFNSFSLAQIGVRTGDVLSVRNTTAAGHVEIIKQTV